MTTDEAYKRVRSEQPPLLYLTGKTCTGKTTFSDRLKADCEYEVIELDRVVINAIIEPFDLLSSQGDVFVSIYKTAGNAEWIDLFVNESQKRIKALLARGKKVIVDGAIANPDVIRRLLDDLPEVRFIYFHPVANSKNYLRNLTARFMNANAQNPNGLPNTFWDCINQDSFARFCQDRTITTQLERGIARYAEQSSRSSTKRLETLRGVLPRITVVEI